MLNYLVKRYPEIAANALQMVVHSGGTIPDRPIFRRVVRIQKKAAIQICYPDSRMQ